MRLTLLLTLALSLMGEGFDWNLPNGFPKPVVPADNPMSDAKVELGRYLFYDQRISLNGKESCGTCHRQELAFTDGRAHAEGTTGQVHPRSSMSLVNIAYAPRLTWADPGITSLEQQALIPMLGEQPVELGLKGREQEFLDVLSRDPVYQKLFPLGFPGETDLFSLPHVAKAIATFERTIISMRSPYDRYRRGDEPSAISDAAKRGEILFYSSERARCFQCHSDWNFRGGYFNTGVTAYAQPNRGLYENTHIAEDIGKFRAPTLRNIAVTAPYMHDGSLATLEDVIEHYSAGGRLDHPNKSRILRPLSLTSADKRDLVEFLKSLTDEELLHNPRLGNPWQR